MPTATKREESEYKFPEDEYFPAVLNGVKEKKIEFRKKDRDTKAPLFNDDGTPAMDSFYKWVWQFEITEGDYQGEYGYAETRAEYTTREDDQVRQFSEALLGRELEVGEELDTDAMLNGLPCMIAFKHGEPRPKKDGTSFYPCDVTEVLPRGGEPTF